MYVAQDGDELQIVYRSSANHIYSSWTFRTSDHTSADTWDSAAKLVEIAGPTSGASPMAGIRIRSSTSWAVAYQGKTDKNMGTDYDRVDYATYNGTSWNSVGNQVDGASTDQIHYTLHQVGPSASSAMQMVWDDGTNTDTRSLSSGDSLGTIYTLASSVMSSTRVINC
jgi:hypothetical protein